MASPPPKRFVATEVGVSQFNALPNMSKAADVVMLLFSSEVVVMLCLTEVVVLCLTEVVASVFDRLDSSAEMN